MTETGVVARYVLDHRTKITGNYLPAGYAIGQGAGSGRRQQSTG